MTMTTTPTPTPITLAEIEELERLTYNRGQAHVCYADMTRLLAAARRLVEIESATLFILRYSGEDDGEKNGREMLDNMLAEARSLGWKAPGEP